MIFSRKMSDSNFSKPVFLQAKINKCSESELSIFYFFIWIHLYNICITFRFVVCRIYSAGDFDSLEKPTHIWKSPEIKKLNWVKKYYMLHVVFLVVFLPAFKIQNGTLSAVLFSHEVRPFKHITSNANFVELRIPSKNLWKYWEFKLD